MKIESRAIFETTSQAKICSVESGPCHTVLAGPDRLPDGREEVAGRRVEARVGAVVRERVALGCYLVMSLVFLAAISMFDPRFDPTSN